MKMQTESNWKDDEEFIEGYAASNVESEARKLVSSFNQLQQSLHTNIFNLNARSFERSERDRTW